MRTTMKVAQTGAEKAALTVDEVARSLGVGRVTVFRLLKEGQLRRVKIGKRTVVPAQDVLDLVDRLASFPEGCER